MRAMSNDAISTPHTRRLYQFVRGYLVFAMKKWSRQSQSFHMVVKTAEGKQ